MSRRLIVALCTAIVCFFVVVLGIRVKGVRRRREGQRLPWPFCYTRFGDAPVP